MKKILIISASVGSGHTKAGIALEKTASKLYPGYEIRHVDILDFLKSSAKKNIVESYNSAVKHFPELWKIYFNITNTKIISYAYKKYIITSNSRCAKKFIDFVDKFGPDIAISTHFFPPVLLKQHKNIVNGIVITDYRTHRLWQNNPDDYYFVSTNEMKDALKNKKINSEKIFLSGIPIDPIFYENKSIEKLKNKYKLPSNEPILLVLSGGHGFSNISSIIKNIFSVKQKITIIAVSGKNEKMKKESLKLKAPSHISLITYGWTEQVDELMRVADLIISKPGGLTTTECAVLGKPIIAVNPIPGQEDANAKYILDNDYGRIATDAKELCSDIYYYLSHKQLKPPIFAPHPAAEIILKTLIDAANNKNPPV